MTSPAVPTPAPKPNTWSAIAMAGYIAASLDYVDDTLIAALQSVATGMGPQAALMSNTVIDIGSGVAAGGPMPVGTRSTPASELVYGSQGGQAKQFAANSPWFFPTVSAWAAANPVPPPEQPQAPQDGSLPMQAPA